MRVSCSTSTALALHRVFLTSAELCTQRAVPAGASSVRSRISTCSPTVFSTQARQYANPPQQQRGFPRDETIQSMFVQLVDEDGKLMPPDMRSRVLASIDRSKDVLVQVASQEGQPAICKVMDKSKLRESERAKSKAKSTRNANHVLKQLELNWAIDANDLGHRLDRMQFLLEKGNRVDVVLAAKRRGRKATTEEAEGVLSKIRARIEATEGAKEIKPMEGRMLATATLFFEGKKKTLEDPDVNG